jgi:DNA-directed RNA polymerase subunit RPC12/RpoP
VFVLLDKQLVLAPVNSPASHPKNFLTASYQLPKSQKHLKIDYSPDIRKLHLDPVGSGYTQNKLGCIRWKIIRYFYETGCLTESQVKDLYVKWRDTDERLWMDAYDDSYNYLGVVFMKAAKRGNDVFKDRVSDKFSFLDGLQPKEFFNPGSFERKKSPMLFVTLTVDTKWHSLKEAWNVISHELHVFETKLRQKYGKFVKLAVKESHKSGYPHMHVVYYFPHRTFEVFEHYSLKYRCNSCGKRFKFSGSWDKAKHVKCKHCGSKDVVLKQSKRTWRIPKKDNDTIGHMWNMGYVDVQAVQDTLGAFSEVVKYVTKEIWTDKGTLTNAMLCLFNKKAYYISNCHPYQLPPHRENARYCIKCGAQFTDQFIDQHPKAHYAKCPSCKRQTQIVDFPPSLKNLDTYDQICIEYQKQHIHEFCKKDFVGAIWGIDAYKRLYKYRAKGLNEPDFDDLVTEFMQDCNINNSKIAFLMFRGVVRHDHIKQFMPDLSDEYIIKADPPPEMRAHFNDISDSKRFDESGVFD